MKKYLLYFVLLLLLGVGGMYYYTQRDSRNDIVNRKPSEEISAVALLQAFEQDEKVAEDRFLGKTIEVSGQVQSIDTNTEKTTITLDTGDPISAIVCEMNNNLKTDFSQIMEGQDLALKGECSGKLMDIILVNCVMIN